MPLSGVRVVDLTRLAPGPYATRLLAELGADVIKVEAPAGGDYTRYTPPVTGDPPTSGVFRELNHGKRSIVLDLKRPAAQLALRRLIATADVLADGFRPGVLTRLGLDPKALMEAYPRLIYCALTGYGLTGPDASRAGHDLCYCARAGVAGLIGPADHPAVAGVQMADMGAGLAAVAGISAALYEREKTNRGRVVDISLAESALAFNALNFGVLHAGQVPGRGREILYGSRPSYSVYRTADDRFLAVGALEPKFWLQFLATIGLPELADASLDADGEARDKVQARLREKTRDEWVDLFRQVDCCVEPVLDLDEVEKDAHMAARQITDPGGMVRSPIHVTDWAALPAPARPLHASPDLGADTESVLREAGLDDNDLAALLNPDDSA